MYRKGCLVGSRVPDGCVGFGSCDIQQIWLSGPEKIVVLAKYKSTSSVSFFRLTAYDITKTNRKKKKKSNYEF